MTREDLERNKSLIKDEVKKMFFEHDTVRAGIKYINTQEALDRILEKCNKVSDKKIIMMYYHSIVKIISDKYIESGMDKIEEIDDLFLEIEDDEKKIDYYMDNLISEEERIGILAKKINNKISAWFAAWGLCVFGFMVFNTKYMILVSVLLSILSSIQVVRLFIFCRKNKWTEELVYFARDSVTLLGFMTFVFIVTIIIIAFYLVARIM